MTPAQLRRIRTRLTAFAQDIFESIPRKDQRRWGQSYLRGLLLDGKRKSIQPMATRLAKGDPQADAYALEQALQQFVNQSPWDPVPVRRRLAERMTTAIGPAAWVIDDTGFPKFGRYSVGVAPQSCGALGKVANCQVGVSVHAATDQASCPIDWRLFLPESWDDDAERRRKAHVPADQRHRPKWQLALDMLDELAAWDLAPPVILADAAYGEVNQFRLGLEQRQLAYVVQVPGTISAYSEDVAPETVSSTGRGRPSLPRYRQRRWSLRQLVLATGAQAAHTVAWREGADGQQLAARFVALRVRPAGVQLRRAARGGQLPVRWLLAEWPQGEPEPVKYWLASLPETTPPAAAGPPGQAALAGGTRLSGIEGRAGPGPLRGSLLQGLAPPRDPGLGRACLCHLGAAGPKSPCVGLTTFAVVRELQLLLAGWAGACPLCLRRLPKSMGWWQPAAAPT
jgi:SRSO17 transposase